MCQLWGGDVQDPHRHPRAWLTPGRAAGLTIHQVSPGQASPAAAPRRASLAGTQRPALAARARRFPSPGEELGKDPTAQVRPCSRTGGPVAQPLPRIDFSVNSPLL